MYCTSPLSPEGAPYKFYDDAAAAAADDDDDFPLRETWDPKLHISGHLTTATT